MDQLLNNPPLGKGGYAIFHEPSLLLDLSKNCWDVQTTWKPTLDDCAKAGKMYSIETLVSTRSYHIVSALSSTASSRCTCNVPSKMTANLDIRTAVMRQSPCSTAVALFLAALLTDFELFDWTARWSITSVPSCSQLALRMTNEWLKSTQSRLPSLNVNECVADLIRDWRCTWAFP